MKASLAAAGRPHVRLEYVNKAFPDGHASRTVACFAEMLEAGSSSSERQETANNIFHVVSRLWHMSIFLMTFIANDLDTQYDRSKDKVKL